MIERLLRRFIPHEDIGWIEIGERFTRYFVWRSRWFNVFIHQMYAPIAPPLCHDHPWSFVSLVLKKGYWESTDGQTFAWRPSKSILYRPAEFRHTVKTDNETAWSLVVTGPKRRQWGNHECR
jgi:hypothetical protein